MTAAELPAWTDYIISLGPWTEYAKFMEDAAAALGGLRIMDLGDGRIALDDTAVEQLRRQPEDADGCIEDTGGELLMWIEGRSFPVSPAGD